MTRAVCPGSFDPPTWGHVDIVRRAAALFDHVTVAVLINPDKSGLFTIDERLELLADVVTEVPNVSVESFRGLLVDYCRQRDIQVIVKGIRAVSDFDYELQMAQMNASLTGVQTAFLPAAPEHAYLSSSLVKQVAGLGGDVSRHLPPSIYDALSAKLAAGDPGS